MFAVWHDEEAEEASGATHVAEVHAGVGAALHVAPEEAKVGTALVGILGHLHLQEGQQGVHQFIQRYVELK